MELKEYENCLTFVCNEDEYRKIFEFIVRNDIDWETLQLSEQEQSEYEDAFVTWLEGIPTYDRAVYFLLKRSAGYFGKCPECGYESEDLLTGESCPRCGAPIHR